MAEPPRGKSLALPRLFQHDDGALVWLEPPRIARVSCWDAPTGGRMIRQEAVRVALAPDDPIEPRRRAPHRSDRAKSREGWWALVGFATGLGVGMLTAGVLLLWN